MRHSRRCSGTRFVCLTASRPDPTALETAVPNWSVGDVMTVERGKQFRVIAIDDFPHAELVEQDVRAIFTVEPV